MNTATVFHRTAMEFYDLAKIYKAKGETEFFDDYRERAWLLEQEAAFQMLSEPEDFTFKYLVIQSAGQLGFELKRYEAAKRILELGLMGNPEELERFQMQEILTQIAEQTATERRDSDVAEVIVGTLTAANIEQRTITIRDSKNQKLYAIFASIEVIKNLLRFYLGEWVQIHFARDEKGSLRFEQIKRLVA